jgi:Opioid growth factor receptor (OGFr) conserved region
VRLAIPDLETLMSQLTEFYRGTGCDAEGRSLSEIWAFSDREMEDCHDFIQWLFPLREASRFNPNAPLLTHPDVAAFRSEPLLRENLLRSLDRFLDFLGLKRLDDAFDTGTEFAGKSVLWTVPNHNWLRITRVLHSLRVLGLEEHAERLCALLEGLNERGQARITRDTLDYWRNAAHPG